MWTSEKLQIRIRVVDESGVDVDSIILRLDDEILSHEWENGCFVLAEVDGLEEGWHSLKISARDKAGNLGTAMLRFRIFFLERTVEILSENLIVQHDQVYVSLMVRNPKAGTWEESLRVRLDGVENVVPISVPPDSIRIISVSLPAKDLPGGAYTLSVLRQDGENISSRTVLLLRKTTFPFLPLLSVAAIFVIVAFLVRRHKKPGEILAESTT